MKGLARTREHAARENTFKQKNLAGNELTFYSLPFLGILDAIIKKRSVSRELSFVLSFEKYRVFFED